MFHMLVLQVSQGIINVLLIIPFTENIFTNQYLQFKPFLNINFLTSDNIKIKSVIEILTYIK